MPGVKHDFNSVNFSGADAVRKSGTIVEKKRIIFFQY
jgi:hypothetical protein